MPLNEEQQLALDSVVDGNNVFITGGAGVGKSFLVSHIVENTPFIAVTAMTGCAALLIGGTTLHSHLGIGLAKDTPQKLAMLARKYPGVAERIINMQALLIDEVCSHKTDENFVHIRVPRRSRCSATSCLKKFQSF
jgi:ATP-dependent DNA helicase PIF1